MLTPSHRNGHARPLESRGFPLIARRLSGPPSICRASCPGMSQHYWDLVCRGSMGFMSSACVPESQRYRVEVRTQERRHWPVGQRRFYTIVYNLDPQRLGRLPAITQRFRLLNGVIQSKWPCMLLILLRTCRYAAGSQCACASPLFAGGRRYRLRYRDFPGSRSELGTHVETHILP